MTDSAVSAVAEALAAGDNGYSLPSGEPDYPAAAQVAVDAYRRQVLASHPDAERLQLIRGWVGSGHAGPAAETTRYLLAALADSDAARQAAEADRDRVVEEVRRLAGSYPADVFPTDSDSRDAIAGTALRTVLGRLAERLDGSPVTEAVLSCGHVLPDPGPRPDPPAGLGEMVGEPLWWEICPECSKWRFVKETREAQ